MKFSKLLYYHFFIPDFNLLIIKRYIESFYIDIILEQNKVADHIHNNFTVPCEKSKIVSFASSIMKNIVVFAFPSWTRFLVKLNCCICCIAFNLLDQHQVFAVYLNLFLSSCGIY